MELPNLPPRLELAVPQPAREARVPPRATSTAPETLRPVLAAEASRLPAPIKGLGIAPLDVFQVGDRDETPPPPEPPRKSVMLSVLPTTGPTSATASAPPSSSAPAPTPAFASTPMAEGAEAAQAAADASHGAKQPPAPASQPAHPNRLPQLVAALDLGSEPRIVDLRR